MNEQTMHSKAARSTLAPSGGSAFEIVDATSDETYYTHGLFLSLPEAIAAVEELGVNPCSLGGSFDDTEDFAKIEIRERKIGWDDHWKVAWSRSWNQVWPDEGDRYWEIIMPNAERTDAPGVR